MIHISYGVPEEKLLFRFELDFTQDTLDLNQFICTTTEDNENDLPLPEQDIRSIILPIPEVENTNNTIYKTSLQVIGKKEYICVAGFQTDINTGQTNIALSCLSLEKISLSSKTITTNFPPKITSDYNEATKRISSLLKKVSSTSK